MGALMTSERIHWPEPPPTRIVLVDEHPIFRDGLRRLLDAEPGLTIEGEAGDCAGAVSLVRQLTPDLLLLGVPSAGAFALDTLRQIAALGISVRTILLTRSLAAGGLLAALDLGARGIVPKEAAADVLLESIECVMAGHQWVGLERVSNLSASVRRLDVERRQAKAFGLTPRELEIVRAVLKGETNKAIAMRCAISENTVKRHLMNIFNKVGASNRVELAVFAGHHQLIQLA
jgi:DNA-binding NarL/FixJ family response regulator